MNFYTEALGALKASTDSESRHHRALIHLNAANVLGDVREVDEGVRHLDEAIAEWGALVRDPLEANRREDVAFAFKAKSSHLMKMGRPHESLEASARSAEILEALVFRHGRHHLAAELGKLLAASGINYLKLMGLDRAAAAFRKALEAFGLATLEHETAEVDGAKRAISGYLDGVEALISIKPKDFPVWTERVQELVEQAQQIGQAGRVDLSCEFLDEASTICTAMLQRGASTDLLLTRARVFVRKGVSAMYVGLTDVAEAAFRGAITDLESVGDGGKGSGQIPFNDWARTILGLATHMRLAGNEQEAQATAKLIAARAVPRDRRERKIWLSRMEEFLREEGPSVDFPTE